MNKDMFQGQWNEFKGKIKEHWGKLTDDELTQINGKWDQFIGKLQSKYGWTKEKAETEWNNWYNNLRSRTESMTHSREPSREKVASGKPSSQRPSSSIEGRSDKQINQPGQKSKNPSQNDRNDRNIGNDRNMGNR